MRPEHLIYTIPLRLWALFRWAQADLELADELRDHLERKTEEYVKQGMTQKEAHRRARLDMDGIEQCRFQGNADNAKNSQGAVNVAEAKA